MAYGADGTECRRIRVRVGIALLAAAVSLGLSSAALGATSFQATEGASFAGGSVTTPQGCNANAPAPSVDWNDGTTSTGACALSGQSATTGSHTYAEEGIKSTGVVTYHDFNQAPQTSL